MRKILIIISSFYILTANAQNYLISFAGSGASTTVSTVKVENLTKGTILTINGSDILRLTSATGINSIEDNQSSELKIYPNPMTYYSTIEVYPPVEGDAIITVLDFTGKQIAQIQSYVDISPQGFRLSGIKRGIYLVNIKGNNYKFSGKLLCNGESNGTAKIEKVLNNRQADYEKASKTDSKGALATVDMAYTTGDRLKLTATSGNYSTVRIDIPASNKTINFMLMACTDGDNNIYPVIEIGTQVWMAENLKTTKYNDNSSIPLVIGNTAWSALSTPGYCWYNNDSPANKDIFGAIYNGYAADAASNGGKNVCPTGWHVPTDIQWSTLTDFLINNGYGNQGSGASIAKSMAATSGWTTTTGYGLVGNIQTSNNASGFTARPGGFRSSSNGSYLNIFDIGYWWSATAFYTSSAYYRNLDYSCSEVFRYYSSKREGLSVRCIKD